MYPQKENPERVSTSDSTVKERTGDPGHGLEGDHLECNTER